MTPRIKVSSAFVLLLATLVAGGCQTTPREPVERLDVQVVEVSIPIPCPALANLGPEPTYPDTDEAIQQARNIAERALLYATGRVMRVNRLREYQAAAAACQF